MANLQSLPASVQAAQNPNNQIAPQINVSFVSNEAKARALLAPHMTELLNQHINPQQINIRRAGFAPSQNFSDDLKAAETSAKDALKTAKEGVSLISEGSFTSIALGTIQTLSAVGQIGGFFQPVKSVLAYTAEAARSAKESFAPEHEADAVRKSSYLRQGLGIIHYLGNPEGSTAIQEFNTKIMRNIEYKNWLDFGSNPARARIENVHIITIQQNQEQKEAKLALLASGEALLLYKNGEEDVIRFYSPTENKTYKPTEALPIIFQAPELPPAPAEDGPVIEKAEEEPAVHAE